MDSIEFTIEREAQDLLAYPMHLGRSKRILFLVLGLLLLLFGLGGFLLLGPEGPTRKSLGYCILMGLFFLVLVLTERSMFNKAAKQALKTLDSESWKITPMGFSYSTEGAKVDVEWQRLQSIVVLKEVIVVVGKPGEAWVLPKRCFPGSGPFDQLLEWATRAGLAIDSKAE
ncbi:MAG TPA: YcxB family protein [Holophagaceae bacterium]|nr:YcxB family protein [Holophagaceae bacterium]